MIYISPNVGHAFFGIIALALSYIIMYDLFSSRKAKVSALDRFWGPVMTATSTVYLVGLVASLSSAEMTDIKGGPGQHMLLALFIYVTSLASLRKTFLDGARIVQLTGFAIVMLFHTHGHSHGGAAWIVPYHRLLFIYAITLAALFLVLRLTQARRILYFIGGLYFITAVSLIVYTEPSHSHAATTMAAPMAATEQNLVCASTGATHIVTFGGSSTASGSEVAKLCDQIKIVNNTNQSIEVEAGEHLNHVEYPLVTGQIVREHSSVVVNLTRMGELKLHDHVSEAEASPVLVIR